MLNTFAAVNVDQPIKTFRNYSIAVDDLAMGAVLGDIIIDMATISSDDPLGLYVGSHINYGGVTEKQIYQTTALVDGSVTQNGKNMNVSVAVSASFVITAAHVQNRGTMVRLVAPVAGGSIDMGGFPDPYVDGQRISIFGWLTSRQDIVLPATLSNILADITFNSTTPSHDLVAVSGTWRQAD